MYDNFIVTPFSILFYSYSKNESAVLYFKKHNAGMEVFMSVIPVDSKQFSEFIEESKIFDITRQLMRTYLTSWYEEDAETFVAEMEADLPTVLSEYRFRNTFVSITKNFNFDPPMDTVSCTIHITDEGGYRTSYRAVFDDCLNMIDDFLDR